MTQNLAITNFGRRTLSERLLSDYHLCALSQSCAPQEDIMTLINIFHADHKDRPNGASAVEIFFRVIHNSIYSTDEWIMAVAFFHSWLLESHRTTAFPKMLGYLQCCEESPEDKDEEHEFIDLIKDMLNQNDYIE